MKLLSTLFITLIAAPGVSGTIIIVEFNNDRIIVAADSRDTETIGPPNDHVCKIVQLDRTTFFFATGKLGLTDARTGKSIWNGAELSRVAFVASSQIQDRFTLVRAAANWAELMQEKYTVDLEQFVDKKPSDVISQGFFGDIGISGLRIYRVAIRGMLPPVVKRADTLFTIQQFRSGDLPLETFGDNDAAALVAEFIAGRTARAEILNAEFTRKFSTATAEEYAARRLQSAIEAAISWMPNKSIGGKAHVMTVGAQGGIRWIDPKDECAQSQTK